MRIGFGQKYEPRPLPPRFAVGLPSRHIKVQRIGVRRRQFPRRPGNDQQGRIIRHCHPFVRRRPRQRRHFVIVHLQPGPNLLVAVLRLQRNIPLAVPGQKIHLLALLLRGHQQRGVQILLQPAVCRIRGLHQVNNVRPHCGNRQRFVGGHSLAPRQVRLFLRVNKLVRKVAAALAELAQHRLHLPPASQHLNVGYLIRVVGNHADGAIQPPQQVPRAVRKRKLIRRRRIRAGVILKGNIVRQNHQPDERRRHNDRVHPIPTRAAEKRRQHLAEVSHPHQHCQRPTDAGDYAAVQPQRTHKAQQRRAHNQPDYPGNQYRRVKNGNEVKDGLNERKQRPGLLRQRRRFTGRLGRLRRFAPARLTPSPPAPVPRTVFNPLPAHATSTGATPAPVSIGTGTAQ